MVCSLDQWSLLILQDDASSTHRFGERKSSGILSPYSVNGRLVVLSIAGVAFLLSLILFIATVVVYAGSGSSTNCLAGTAPTTTTPLPTPVFPSTATPDGNRKLTTLNVAVLRHSHSNIFQFQPGTNPSPSPESTESTPKKANSFGARNSTPSTHPCGTISTTTQIRVSSILSTRETTPL